MVYICNLIVIYTILAIRIYSIPDIHVCLSPLGSCYPFTFENNQTRKGTFIGHDMVIRQLSE